MDKPIKNSYCVIEGSVYAGEYAGDLHNPREKMAQFEHFGITHFIDLTVDGELHPYEPIMPNGCIHHRFPIHDVSTPSSVEDVYELLKYIDSLTKEVYNKVYIHCWGGVGRTGTIVACYYEYFGESYDSAVKHLRESFKQCPKSKYRDTPDTNEQLGFIKEFGDYMDYIRAKEEKDRQKDEVQYTPDNIEALQSNEIFVFGSNLAGNHAGGAARVARERFGAIMGQGVGMQGQSYAIPTMQGGVDTIKPYVDDFIKLAREGDQTTFYITRIGCGIAGFTDEQIAPLFVDALELYNVRLPKSFVDVLTSGKYSESYLSNWQKHYSSYDMAIDYLLTLDRFNQYKPLDMDKALEDLEERVGQVARRSCMSMTELLYKNYPKNSTLGTVESVECYLDKIANGICHSEPYDVPCMRYIYSMTVELAKLMLELRKWDTPKPSEGELSDKFFTIYIAL